MSSDFVGCIDQVESPFTMRNYHNLGVTAVLVLLCGSILHFAEASDEYQTGRTLSQTVQPFPAPEGGTISDWQFIKNGSLQGSVVRVFDAIEDPKDALVLAFGQLVYESSTVGSRITRLTLASGQFIDFENTRSGVSSPGLFHLFKIVDHSDGIFEASETIRVVGSQLFIQITGISATTVDIGWLGSVTPTFYAAIIKSLFEGLVEELVDRFKAVFKGDDCLIPGPYAVVRDISAVCNNVDNPFGIAHIPLKTVAGNGFGDGQSTFGGSTISARLISNIVCSEDSSVDNGTNPLGVTDMFTTFGQFIDHDIGVSPVGAFSTDAQPLFTASFLKFRDERPIEVPDNDPVFTEDLEFERAVYSRVDNEEVLPRRILNALTSFLDMSQVYGSTALRARVLRSFEGGKMKITGSGFLPFNGDTEDGVGIALENAPNAETRFPVGGDIRVSENTALLVLQTLFLREHNKVEKETSGTSGQTWLIADELTTAMEGSFTDEKLYQFARAIMIAQFQSIVYTEWLPLLLGSNDLPPEDFSYDPSIDATADAFFTTASFRFGHSMVGSVLWRVDSGQQTPSSVVPVKNTMFMPEILTPSNYDSFLLGMSWHEARDSDEKVVDDLRNFLYSEDGNPRMDLVALNIQRARDMGVPTYNMAREGFGLEKASSFSDISNNPDTVANLALAYDDDVINVDGFIGGLAEKKAEGRLFGDLFRTSHIEQFRRFRDGDRLFYKGLSFDQDLLTAYPRLMDILADNVKLIDVIERNTGVTKSDIGGRASVFQL